VRTASHLNSRREIASIVRQLLAFTNIVTFFGDNLPFLDTAHQYPRQECSQSEVAVTYAQE
jgi:hypothetical protein